VLAVRPYPLPGDGRLFFPPVNETLSYDLDGNLTADARWTYGWDGDNRLIWMEEKPIIGTGPRPPRQRLEYDYDSQSRRIAKRVLRKTHELGDWSLHQHRQFLYDGWNMIGELDVPTNGGTAHLHRSYAWGLDASGTRTGAGGVGGLLLTTHYATPGSGTSSNVTLAPLYDLNANVLAYADVTTSTITHRIDYDPFGNELTLDTLLPTAAAEEAPRFRFSTKYTDSESGLVYYGFRSYSPELGRWVNRDPIEERGGVNLYGMVGNDPVNRWDLLGLEDCSCKQVDARGNWHDNKGRFTTAPTFDSPIPTLPKTGASSPDGRGKDDVLDYVLQQLVIRSFSNAYVAGQAECIRLRWSAKGFENICGCCVFVIQEITTEGNSYSLYSFKSAYLAGRPCSQVRGQPAIQAPNSHVFYEQ